MDARIGQTSELEISRHVSDAIPKNTLVKAKWGMKLFRDWLTAWRVRCDGLKVLVDPEEMTASDLDYCLKFFYADVRKVDGKRYPPSSLKEIAAMIQFSFKHHYGKNFSFFKDKAFQSSRMVLDAEMKLSAKLGSINPPKRAASISFAAENELWENGSLGCSNPKQLLQTLIYSLGLHLSLRACQEHYDLEFGEDGQLKLKKDSNGEYLECMERVSKNKKFGLKCCRIEPKMTRVYQRPDDPNRCPIRIYKEYVAHRPDSHGCSFNKALYLAWIPNPRSIVWYKNSRLGIHSIQQTVRELAKGSPLLEEKFVTNTSLRRTARNRLIEAGIPDEVAKKKTGRLSEKADSAYIEPDSFERNMSEAIHGHTSTIQGHTSTNASSFDRNICLNVQGTADLPTFNFSNCNVSINIVNSKL